MAYTADLGHGTTITFSTTFFANVTDIDWSGLHRDAIPTTTMDTSGGETFIPADTYDPGELRVELQYDAGTAVPITGAAETVTVTFPTTSTMSASGFMTDFDVATADKDVITASATIKFSGTITWA
jgi:hypothetical protein